VTRDDKQGGSQPLLKENTCKYIKANKMNQLKVFKAILTDQIKGRNSVHTIWRLEK